MLTDKVAIVTGAGRGIGRTIALTLAKHGANVAVVDVNLGNANGVVREIEALGQKGLALEVDVSDEIKVKTMIDNCIEHFKRVDVLVNNAGVVQTGPLTDISVEAWDKVMSVNLKGVFLCCKAVFPFMMARKSGKIVNIASVAGKRGGGLLGNSCYAASKGGVIALTKGIAREGGPYNINVNAVAPALTETDMTNSLSGQQRDAIVKMMPLGRVGKPEDIAAAVCFLASENAGFITGEIMDVDGGLTMD